MYSNDSYIAMKSCVMNILKRPIKIFHFTYLSKIITEKVDRWSLMSITVKIVKSTFMFFNPISNGGGLPPQLNKESFCLVLRVSCTFLLHIQSSDKTEQKFVTKV